MGRPRIEGNDAQLRAIMGALAALDRDFPLDNARFLDGLVAAVRAITGRVYDDYPRKRRSSWRLV